MIRAVLTLLVLLSAVSCSPLVNFQVAQPPALPRDARQCTVKLLERTFAFSYGSPEIVVYNPPTDCGPVGSWAGISLNFSQSMHRGTSRNFDPFLAVTSNGTQYDRLGTFSLDQVEIWRTSTPEPTRSGIIWTVTKDVTRYTPLFAKTGTLILQLDNVVTSSLNGEYATQLHATFYASSAKHPPAKKADLIVPISTRRNDTGAQASVPPALTNAVTIPRNAVAIYAEIQASGNGAEEFWYFNAANDYINDLPADTTYGQGPFREVRLLVDGKVAGAVNPYATIFTGGIIPTAWRPITAYGALDLPTYFLDLTPFVPILTDGKPHNISIDVVSAEHDHTINDNWFVSGNLQVITDASNKPTTGRMTSYKADDYAVTSVSGKTTANGDVSITVRANRHISITSDIVSGSGKRNHITWTQSLSYQNTQLYQKNTTVQIVYQTAKGVVASFHNFAPVVADAYSYPLTINVTTNSNFTTYHATFDHSYDRVLLPSPFEKGSTIKERQLADGSFVLSPSGNSGNGSSKNTFFYFDLAGNTYDREVNAALNNITYDHQGGSLAPIKKPVSSSLPPLPFAGARLPGGRVIPNIVGLST